MDLQAVSSGDLLKLVNMHSGSNEYSSDVTPPPDIGSCSAVPLLSHHPEAAAEEPRKRRRRVKICKSKEEAESRRMTHIAVERNRRKQMNEHLAVLRSLMPESYVERGDQASIVGGAIDYVKELEHILQSLIAKKLTLLDKGNNETNIIDNANKSEEDHKKQTLFALHPQLDQYLSCNTYVSRNKAAVAEVRVTLIETHANIRILSRRRVRRLSKIVAAFRSVFLSVLHLNLNAFDSLFLYSVSAKVEEGCQLNSAEDIADAIHQLLSIIEDDEATLYMS